MYYRPPEFGGASAPDAAYDMWSLGCVLSEMVTGKFIADRVEASMSNVMSSYRTDFAKEPWMVAELLQEVRARDPFLGEVVERLLEADPRRRMNAAQLLAMLEGAKKVAAGPRGALAVENAALHSRVEALEERLHYAADLLDRHASAGEPVSAEEIRSTLKWLKTRVPQHARHTEGSMQ